LQTIFHISFSNFHRTRTFFDLRSLIFDRAQKWILETGITLE